MSLTVMWRSLVLVVVRLLASVAYGTRWPVSEIKGGHRTRVARPRDQPRSGIPSGGKYYSLWSFDHAQGATSRRPMSRPDLTRSGRPTSEGAASAVHAKIPFRRRGDPGLTHPPELTSRAGTATTGHAVYCSRALRNSRLSSSPAARCTAQPL
jgi:hypothetical protein